MVLSFAQCGVILHFLISWGWKWRVPVGSALAPLVKGTGLQEQGPGRQLLEHTAGGSSWVSDGRVQQGLVVGSSCHQVVRGISTVPCDAHGFDHLGRAQPVPPGDCISSRAAMVDKLMFVLMTRKRKRYSQPSDNLAQDGWLPPSAQNPGSSISWNPTLPTLVSLSPVIHRFVSACVSFPFLK